MNRHKFMTMVAPIRDPTRAAVASVRQAMLELCTRDNESTPKEVMLLGFASPAWPSWNSSSGYNNPNVLLEFYRNYIDEKSHLIVALRTTNTPDWSLDTRDEHVFLVRPEGIEYWAWNHWQSVSSGESRERVYRDGVVQAEYNGHVEGFDPYVPASGNEKDCNRLYDEHIGRGYRDTSLYRLNKGEVLVQHNFDEQLGKYGATDLMAMAERLKEIKCRWTDGVTVLTPMPAVQIDPTATLTDLPELTGPDAVIATPGPCDDGPAITTDEDRGDAADWLK